MSGQPNENIPRQVLSAATSNQQRIQALIRRAADTVRRQSADREQQQQVDHAIANMAPPQQAVDEDVIFIDPRGAYEREE